MSKNKTQHHSNLLSDELIQSIPLSVRLKVNLAMNSNYFGDKATDKEIKIIIDTVKEWIKDGDLNNF